MKDYYDILKVDVKASSLKVFKAFKKEYLKHKESHSRSLEILEAYLVLMEPSRKFYDLAWRQEKKGTKVTEKYSKVVDNRIKTTKQIAISLDKNPNLITKPLKTYPLWDTTSEFIGFLLEVNYGSVTFGILMILTSFVSFGFFINEGNLFALSLFLILGTVGIFLHERGTLKFKKDKIEKITAHNNNASQVKQ